LSRARVLLADDNAQVANQIRELLEESFDVVGVVSSGEALETAFETLSPAAVVTDIAMPGEGGLAAARRIMQRHPGTGVVVLSVIDAPPIIRVSFSSGIQGYVVKENAADELVPAVEAAMQGRRYVSATARRALGDV
jgi:DNA-binding NarL/FixJ family response regulator